MNIDVIQSCRALRVPTPSGMPSGTRAYLIQDNALAPAIWKGDCVVCYETPSIGNIGGLVVRETGDENTLVFFTERGAWSMSPPPPQLMGVRSVVFIVKG